MKTVGKGGREGEGAGSTPGWTSGGGRKWWIGTKKHSDVTISDIF